MTADRIRDGDYSNNNRRKRRNVKSLRREGRFPSLNNKACSLQLPVPRHCAWACALNIVQTPRMPRNEYVHIHVVGPLDASRSDFSDSIASKHGIECRNRRKRVYNQACSAGSSACGMCKGSSCAHSSSRLRYRRFRWVKYMYTCIHVCSKYRENEKVRKTDKNYQSGTLKSHFFR